MLPIFVFSTVLVMWSRMLLSPPQQQSEENEESPRKLTIKVITSDSE
ncbi:hypothetical protein Lepto7375DRAFT_7055 [Leptolyngbya sp. PCC 7375]|nr:hypothetical protein Lepto7375DRAFT_7055 [Leptolyngbya sp. PCC 7375]